MQRAGIGLNAPGGPRPGLGIKQVVIRSIDTGADTVFATDAGGAEVQLPWRIRRVGITPAVGQTWLVDQALGFWSLAAYIEPS